MEYYMYRGQSKYISQSSFFLKFSLSLSVNILHLFTQSMILNLPVHGPCPITDTRFNKFFVGVAGMSKNHFICNMIEVLSIEQVKCIPCTHCEQPSAGRCVTCELFMCEKCLKLHNDYPGFKDHAVLTMTELSKPANRVKIKMISKCTQHPKKKLKYYCETCDQLICRHCMDFDHDKQHKFLPLEQAAQTKLKDLKKNYEILKRNLDNGNTEINALKKTVESFKDQFDENQRLINESKEKLLAKIHNIMDSKMNSMIEDARKVVEQRTRNIEKEIQEKDAFLRRVKASADFADSLIKDGNDEEIVRSQTSVQENVHNAIETERHESDGSPEDLVPFLSSEDIDKTLLTEVKLKLQEKIRRNGLCECFNNENQSSNTGSGEPEATPEKSGRKGSPQTFRDDKGLAGKIGDDYPKRQEVNNENQSPNTSSGEPERRRSPPPQTQSGGSPRIAPNTTSSPQGTGSHFTPTTVMQTWKNSQQEKYSQMASSVMSQPTSYPPSQHLQVRTAQGQGRGVHDQRSGFPSYSQLSSLSHISQNQGRQEMKSHPKPVPSFFQQRNRHSPLGEATMPYPSYSATKQTPARDQPGRIPITKIIPITKMTAEGFFGGDIIE